MKPKNESKADDMMERKSPIDGMTLTRISSYPASFDDKMTHLPRMNATTQMKITQPIHVPQPMTEWL